MPNKRFSQLDEVTDVQAADDFALERTGVSKRITGASLASELGGSLPAWWTVDSTPGSEEVDFAGEVHINPVATNLYGLLIEPQAGFYDNYNAFIRVIDENGTRVFNIDSGGFDMVALPDDDIHISLRNELGTRTADVSTFSGLTVSDDGVGGALHVGMLNAVQLPAFVPSSTPGFGAVQMYYDETAGAPKVKFRGKDSNGDPFTAEIALT